MDDEADDHAKAWKEVVFAALAAAGIAKVEVEFDGSGDSGQIDNVIALKRNPLGEGRSDLIAGLPTDPVLLPTDDGNALKAGLVHDAIEAMCYEWLEGTGIDWYNNDGGFGTFVFDVAAKTINLDISQRYTTTTDSAFEF